MVTIVHDGSIILLSLRYDHSLDFIQVAMYSQSIKHWFHNNSTQDLSSQSDHTAPTVVSCLLSHILHGLTNSFYIDCLVCTHSAFDVSSTIKTTKCTYIWSSNSLINPSYFSLDKSFKMGHHSKVCCWLLVI